MYLASTVSFFATSLIEETFKQRHDEQRKADSNETCEIIAITALGHKVLANSINRFHLCRSVKTFALEKTVQNGGRICRRRKKAILLMNYVN